MAQIPSEEGTSPAGYSSPGSATVSGNKRRRDGLSQGQNELPRTRNVTACQKCRSRKTKCDNKRPSCTYCATLRLECIYEESPTDKIARYDTGTREILQRLDTMSSALDRLSTFLRPGPSSEILPAPSPMSTTNTTPGRENIFTWPGTAASRQEPSSRLNRISATAESRYSEVGYESLLRWPIVSSHLDSAMRSVQSFPLQVSIDQAESGISRTHSRLGVSEEKVMGLCQRFLEIVHVRNPILNKNDVLNSARHVAEHGFGWDNRSCLVLILCALACISSPFESWSDVAVTPGTNSISTTDYELAESYFHAAKKRIGMLESGLVDIQCFFFAVMYEKNLLRPLAAWHNMQQTCSRLLVYLQSRRSRGLEADTRNLVERLFWSCIKAEAEMAEHLPLRLSGLHERGDPLELPAPPTRDGCNDDDHESGGVSVSMSPNEEKSWFYYLGELAIRRIFDREVSLLYPQDSAEAWMTNMHHYAQQCALSDEQIRIWSIHLPPHLGPHQSQHVDQLTALIEGRLLMCRAVVLRPMVYCALHYPNDPHRSLPTDVKRLAQECIRVHVTVIERVKGMGRHGGTWFGCRDTWYSAIILLTLANQRHPRLETPKNWRELVTTALDVLSYWKGEAADVKWMHDILHDLFWRVCHELSVS